MWVRYCTLTVLNIEIFEFRRDVFERICNPWVGHACAIKGRRILLFFSPTIGHCRYSPTVNTGSVRVDRVYRYERHAFCIVTAASGGFRTRASCWCCCCRDGGVRVFGASENDGTRWGRAVRWRGAEETEQRMEKKRSERSRRRSCRDNEGRRRRWRRCRRRRTRTCSPLRSDGERGEGSGARVDGNRRRRRPTTDDGSSTHARRADGGRTVPVSRRRPTVTEHSAERPRVRILYHTRTDGRARATPPRFTALAVACAKHTDTRALFARSSVFRDRCCGRLCVESPTIHRGSAARTPAEQETRPPRWITAAGAPSER